MLGFEQWLKGSSSSSIGAICSSFCSSIFTLGGSEICGESCVPGIGGALPVLGTLLGRLSLDTRLTTLPLLN